MSSHPIYFSLVRTNTTRSKPIRLAQMVRLAQLARVEDLINGESQLGID